MRIRNLFGNLFERKEKTSIELSLAQPGDERAITEVMQKAWLFAYPNKERGITEDDINHRWQSAYSDERLAKQRAEFGHQSETERVFVAKEHEKFLACAVS